MKLNIALLISFIAAVVANVRNNPFCSLRPQGGATMQVQSISQLESPEPLPISQVYPNAWQWLTSVAPPEQTNSAVQRGCETCQREATFMRNVTQSGVSAKRCSRVPRAQGRAE
ncbi:hypothetical protein B0H19DRAFT_1253910 [Mycena capillaripes]|nr:hypothetical protein B0H19DRAFT_1253910 [Mycena capillaripes]